MIAIIKRIMRDRFWPLFGYTIGGIGLVFIYVAMIPSLQESQAQVQELMQSMPADLLKALGVSGVDMSSLESLLAMKQYNIIWPLLMIFFLVSFAGATVAAEVENRTIEITLSTAKNRAKIFISKYLSGFIYLLIFTIATTLCAIPMAKAFGYSYIAENYYSLMNLSLAFSFAIYGISMLLSSAFNSKGRVYALSGLIYVAMYVIFIVSSLKESLADLKYLSFFYYFNVNDALIFNKLDSNSVLIFLGVGLACSIASYVLFEKRDFSV